MLDLTALAPQDWLEAARINKRAFRRPFKQRVAPAPPRSLSVKSCSAELAWPGWREISADTD